MNNCKQTTIHIYMTFSKIKCNQLKNSETYPINNLMTNCKNLENKNYPKQGKETYKCYGKLIK